MKRAVIYIPGLGDQRSKGQELVIVLWRLYGIQSELFLFGWNTAGSFQSKFDRLLKRIDQLHATGFQVSLVGASAGATAVVNAFAVRQDSIHAAACICGALRGTKSKTVQQSSGSVFTDSASQLYENFARIPAENRKKILSIRPLEDRVVPPIDTIMDGTEQLVIPTRGHALSIGLAITVYSYKIIRFVRR